MRDSPETVGGDGFDRDRFNAEVREALDSLDGSPEASVAVLAGVPVEQFGEYEETPAG